MAKIKVLILRFSSIGDIILTTPVIRCLKKQLSQVEIHYCTKLHYRQLIESNPYIDKCIYLEDSILALIKQLKNEKYDYIIDLHHNIRTLSIKSALKVKNFSFNKLNYKKWLYVNFKIDSMPDVHIVDRYLDTLKSLGVRNDQAGLDYFIPSKDDLKRYPKGILPGDDYVAFAIGGQHQTKKMPISKILELCRKINYPIVFLGDHHDARLADEVIQTLEKENHFVEEEEGNWAVKVATRTQWYNACGKYNINQSASIIRDAKYVISHDTGLMHIAASFKKKIYSIWGSTTPALGMYPYKTSFVTIENKDLKCRPCSKIGYQQCPYGHFKCMNELSLEIPFPEE
ncbi:MAG: glycosyltransferase family 9 protein [Microscillaceae bacterium]|nr:glycosyltransferase family 9 protein [Microscillaceae bacterium]